MKKILILLLILFASNIYAKDYDFAILKEINLHRNKSLDPTFKFLTNSATPIVIAAPIIIYSIGLIEKDSLLKTKGLYIGETELGAAIIATILKYSIDRDRPFYTHPAGVDVEALEGSPSFPSGHTSAAFSMATSMSIAFPKWYVTVPAFVWAGAVGYSRMDLGVHYPTDVLAGAAIGAGSAYLCYKLNKWLNKKKR